MVFLYIFTISIALCGTVTVDNIKSIIDNSLNKNSQNSKKNETKAESQNDLENTILKELSK